MDFFPLPSIVIPHVTDAIQEWVERVAQIPVAQDQKRPDVCVIEVRKTKEVDRRGGKKEKEREIKFYWIPIHHTLFSLASLVALSETLRVCHLWRRSGSFSFDVVILTLPTSTSAWCRRYGTTYHRLVTLKVGMAQIIHIHV